jgi:hypothetical protein
MYHRKSRKTVTSNMNKETLEISADPNKAHATDKADKLRTELRRQCLEFDTSDIEDKLVQAVTQYTTPQARRQEIVTIMQSGNHAKQHPKSCGLNITPWGALSTCGRLLRFDLAQTRPPV